MSNLSNREVYQRFSNATLAGDWATVRSLLHKDFELREASCLPYGGIYRGVEGWIQFCQAVFAAIANFEATTDFIIGDGEDGTLAIMVSVSGTLTKSGRRFKTSAFECWRFEDGLIRECRPFYWDTKEIYDLWNAPASD